MAMDNITFAIEELGLSGAISLGNCSRSTVYRWAKEINERLEFEKYDWRVRPCVAERSLYVVGLEPGTDK